jgi:hypothetical protein
VEHLVESAVITVQMWTVWLKYGLGFESEIWDKARLSY